jgi:hypothetical protein
MVKPASILIKKIEELDSCSEHLVLRRKKETPTYPLSKSNPLVPILGR